jgi:hypothetical protein
VAGNVAGTPEFRRCQAPEMGRWMPTAARSRVETRAARLVDSKLRRQSWAVMERMARANAEVRRFGTRQRHIIVARIVLDLRSLRSSTTFIRPTRECRGLGLRLVGSFGSSL